MKILYLSCHSVLEFEEVSLLTELGHEVFSPGAYVEPLNPGDASLRPEIPGLIYDQDILAKFHKIGHQYPGQDSKDHLTKELIDCFDMIIVMHLPRWIRNNWPIMRHKPVIWRTIGQSISSTERDLKFYRADGLKIVRYSPMERNIPGYIGEDATIRFYKDPNEYKGWTGQKKRVITFAQSMQQRDRACNFTIFEQVTRSYNRRLFGPGSENLDWGAGKVPFDQLKQELKTNRVYFYTGTHPASYTLNFMEAFMTGIPIVAVGSKFGNANYFPGHNLYEIPGFINNGANGFISNNIVELEQAIKVLMTNDAVAKSISEEAREDAVRIFGKDTIKEQWNKFLQ